MVIVEHRQHMKIKFVEQRWNINEVLFENPEYTQSNTLQNFISYVQP